MKRRSGSPGFSLIESVCCLFLLSVVYALASYAFQTFLPRYRLEGAVGCLVSDFQAARMKAIAHNCSYRIRIRPERTEYFLERESLNGPGNWAGEAEGGVRKWDDPQNPYFFPGVEILSRSNDPVFLPRGAVIGTTVLLKNASGQRKVVLSSQGRIRIEEH